MLRRSLILVAAVSFGLAVVPATGPAGGVEGCQPRVRFLEPPTEYPGAGVRFTAINGSGLAAGQFAGGGPLIMWDAAGEHSVYEDNDFSDQNVSAMDRDGMVVGFAVPQDSEAVFAWTFMDGTFDYLPTQRPKQQSIARDIAAGRIVGSLISGDGQRGRAVVWDGPNVAPERLPLLPGYDESSAFAVNPGGSIYGSMSAEGVPSRLVRWGNGRVKTIDTPREFQLAAIAGRHVVGSALIRSGKRVPAAFSQGSWELLRRPGGYREVTSSGYAFGWLATDRGDSDVFVTHQGELTLLKGEFVAATGAHHLTVVFTKKTGGFKVRTCYSATIDAKG